MKKTNCTPLKPNTQKRLMAYSTAASLGAFFAGQNADAQVVESAAFAPYPRTILPNIGGTGPSVDYHYFQVDGGAPSDFNLNVNSNRVDIGGSTSTNFVLNPSSDAYVIPWTVGSIIATNTGSVPTYKRFLATGYKVGNYHYENSKFLSMGAMGFSFISGLDHMTHYGYMDIYIPVTNIGGGNFYVQEAVITGVFYNQTPNAPITVQPPPVFINITGITMGAGNAVTINFTSTDNSQASNFTLETSTTLGPGANWAADPSASITAISPGVYQATTTGLGGAAQFYQIVEAQ